MKFLIFLTFFSVSLFCAPLSVDVSARSAILMNAKTGRVLYEKEARVSAYPASTTKLATALFAVEKKGLSKEAVFKISSEALRKKGVKEGPGWLLADDGTSMDLVKGEEVSIEALVHGLLLVSGNDAANALAEAASGSLASFVQELNPYLKSLGCEQTRFVNPHGLHHPDHVTTAYDLALIGRKVLENSFLREVALKRSYHKRKTNKKEAVELEQFNRLMKPGKHYYPRAIGLKTGYHQAAQYTLVAAAEDQERTLVAVVLGCPSSDQRYVAVRKLFDAAFQEKKIEKQLLAQGQVYEREVEGGKTKLEAFLSQELKVSFYPAEEPQLKAFLQWKNLCLPIEKGQVVGEIRVMDEAGEMVTLSPLLAQEQVKPKFLFSLKQFFRKLNPFF